MKKKTVSVLLIASIAMLCTLSASCGAPPTAENDLPTAAENSFTSTAASSSESTVESITDTDSPLSPLVKYTEEITVLDFDGSDFIEDYTGGPFENPVAAYTADNTEFSEIMALINSFHYTHREEYNDHAYTPGTNRYIVMYKSINDYRAHLSVNLYAEVNGIFFAGYMYYVEEDGLVEELAKYGSEGTNYLEGVKRGPQPPYDYFPPHIVKVEGDKITVDSSNVEYITLAYITYSKDDPEFNEILDIISSFAISHTEEYRPHDFPNSSTPDDYKNPVTGQTHSLNFEMAPGSSSIHAFTHERNAIFVREYDATYGHLTENGIWCFSDVEGSLDRLLELSGLY